MADKTTTTEVTTEDKIAKLKTTLEGLETLGATIPQQVKDAVIQELATLEAKLKEEIQEAETEVSSFWLKYRVELIVTALLIISHIATKVGF